jgi:hypothetical protein
MNCKPGDLAVITMAAGVARANIGRLVEVLYPVGPDLERGPCWRVRMVGRKGVTIQGVYRQEGNAYDCALRPVSGLPDEERTFTTHQEPTHV